MSFKTKIKEMKPLDIVKAIAFMLAVMWLLDNLPDIIRAIISFFH